MYEKELAIGGIIALELFALWTGVNGATFSLVLAILGAVAGFEFQVQRMKKSQRGVEKREE